MILRSIDLEIQILNCWGYCADATPPSSAMSDLRHASTYLASGTITFPSICIIQSNIQHRTMVTSDQELTRIVETQNKSS